MCACVNPPPSLTSSPVDGNLDLLRAEREELAKEMWEKEKAKERVKVWHRRRNWGGRGALV